MEKNLLTELNERLVTSQIEESRILAAGMIGLTKEQQMKLALDESVNVRIRLSGNEFILPEVLVILSKDDDWLVKANTGKHERTPEEVVHMLENDNDLFVHYCALSNPRNEKAEIYKQELNDKIESLLKAILCK